MYKTLRHPHVVCTFVAKSSNLTVAKKVKIRKIAMTLQLVVHSICAGDTVLSVAADKQHAPAY